MDSFSKRRPPKFTEPVDFNKINNLFESGNDNSYSNLLLERFTGLFSSDWNTSVDHGPFNFSGDLPLNSTTNQFNNNNNGTNNSHIGTNNNGGLYSSNLAHAFNGINSNPFNTKGITNFDYNNQWIAPRSCPPIGSRSSQSFNSFSVNPTNHPTTNTINSNLNNNTTVTSANNLHNNLHNFSNNGHNLTSPVNLNNGYHNLTSPVNLNNTNNSFAAQNHSTLATNNNNINAANNALQASYVPPRVRRRNPTCTECVFCKNNGHPPSFYKSHILKDPEGKIVCPMLRCYSCPICKNGGGDKAHTVRYCPWNKPSFWHRIPRT